MQTNKHNIIPETASSITTEELAKSGKLPLHPYCTLFPKALDLEIASMAESIVRNGLRERIILYMGQIIDGRNRYLACLEAGVSFEPFDEYFDEYKGDTTDEGLLQFVMDHNASRRHLKDGQKAMIADRMSGKKSKKSSNPPVGGLTQVVAAKMMGISEREVQRAAALRRIATKELIAEVESGLKTISKALSECKSKEDETKKRKERENKKETLATPIDDPSQETQEQVDGSQTGGTDDSFLKLMQPKTSEDSDNDAPFTFDKDKESKSPTVGSEEQPQSYADKFSEDVANFKLTIKRRPNDLSQEEGMMFFREFRKLMEWLRDQYEDTKKMYAPASKR